jgi:hypothetical protein
MTFLRILLLLALGAAMAGCGDDPAKPYLKIRGGGFVFNYRYSTLSYGFAARAMKPLPEGSVLEAQFDIPGSSERWTTSWPMIAGKLDYGFESPPLTGVEKGKPYKVTLRLLESKGGKELAVIEKSFTPSMDQSELPSVPLVKPGPGYEPNE